MLKSNPPLSPVLLFVLKSRTAESVSVGEWSGGDLGDVKELEGINIGGDEEDDTRGDTDPCGDVMTSLCNGWGKAGGKRDTGLTGAMGRPSESLEEHLGGSEDPLESLDGLPGSLEQNTKV